VEPPGHAASPAAVVVRQFKATDGDTLRHLWQAVGFRSLGDDDASLALFAKRNPGMFFVAEAAGEVVGSTMGAWDGRRGWLYHVAVVSTYRRTGLATRLVRLAEDALRAAGSPRSLVIVETDNVEAFEFWQALGYEIRGTRHLGKGL
jgi:ribosomal protein S18 acetylase RimI-like enzyme